MRERKARQVALATLALIVAVALAFAWQQQRRMQALEEHIDPRAWAELYPLHVASFFEGAAHDAGPPRDKLAANPFRQHAWAGNAFALEYNQARAHYYAQTDQHQSRRSQEREQPAGCIHCHAAEAPRLVQQYGWDDLNVLMYHDIQDQVHHGSTCTDCHAAGSMALEVNRSALLNAMEHLGIDPDKESRQVMRSHVCAQCHVEYYFREGTQELVFPWQQGLRLEDIEAFYDDIGFSDWHHADTGAGLIKIQHPNMELHSTSVHARHDTACADCHMPTVQRGGMRITDHSGGSPLSKIEAACLHCHSGTTSERLYTRSRKIQQNTRALMDITEQALTELMHAITKARAAGVSDSALEPALKAHRRAHIRWDFIDADASLGFHSPQETVRLLTDAARMAREGVEGLEEAGKD